MRLTVGELRTMINETSADDTLLTDLSDELIKVFEELLGPENVHKFSEGHFHAYAWRMERFPKKQVIKQIASTIFVVTGVHPRESALKRSSGIEYYVEMDDAPVIEVMIDWGGGTWSVIVREVRF